MNRHELDRGARVLRALAHPVRLGVLQCLAAGERSVGDLHRALGCSQSMMSQQLRILEEQGLVVARKTGTVKLCALGNPDFLSLLGCLQHHLGRLPGSAGAPAAASPRPAATPRPPTHGRRKSP